MYGDNVGDTTDDQFQAVHPQTCTTTAENSLCGNHLYTEYILLCEIFDYMVKKTNEILKDDNIEFVNNQINYCNTDLCGFIKSEPLLKPTESSCPSNGSLKSFIAGSAVLGNEITLVFGTMDSGLAAMDAVLFAQKCIPIFPIIATTSQLDSNENFMRTMPSDTDQVYVILQLLNKLNISLVSVVYDQSYYGSGLFYAFQTQLRYPKNNTGRVCIDLAVQLPQTLTKSTLDHYIGMLNILRAPDHARTLVVFMKENTFKDLLHVYRNSSNDIQWLQKFVVITADNAYREDFGQFSESLNVVSIQPNIQTNESEYNVSQFEEHLKYITIAEAHRQTKINLMHLIAQTNNCSPPAIDHCADGGVLPSCPNSTTLPQSMFPIHQVTQIATEYTAQTFIQLRKYFQNLSKHILNNADCDCSNGRQVMEELQHQVSDTISKLTYYSVYMFQSETGSLRMVEIGKTTRAGLDLALNDNVSNLVRLVNSTGAYTQASSCKRHHCGQLDHVWSFSVDCRKCVLCPSMYHRVTSKLDCEPCPPGHIPNKISGDNCTTDEAVDYNYIKDSASSKATLFLAALGLTLTFLTSFVVTRKRDTPIIRVARPEVLLIQCISCTIDFIICFLALCRMDNTLCATQWISFCLSLAVSTTSVLSKLHQYSALRRFPPLEDTELRSVMIGLIWSLCLVQVIIVLAMFVIAPPKNGFVPRADFPQYYPVCSWYDKDPTIALIAYPICLLVVATSVSFKYSNLVFTFIKREMRYILVGSSLCAGVIVVFCPIILFEIQEQQMRVIWFNVLVLLVGFFKLVFLLLPSVVIVVFKAHLNTKQYVCEQSAPRISPGGTWPPAESENITNGSVLRGDLGIIM